MNQVTINRTPDLIAAEINNIKNQTRKIVLYNSIEIGRRLTEAKTLISHGEWGKWLEESVDYSQSTANNLMRIFQEYGADQISLLGEAKSQAFGNLSYSQAVALLGVPKEEREQFIEENEVENMSTRELQRAIKEKEQAIKEKQELELKLETTKKEVETKHQLYETVSKSYNRLEETNKEHYQRAENLHIELELTKKKLQEAEASGDSEEVEELEASLKKTQEELNDYKRKIEELEKQLQEKPVEVNAETIVEKIPEEIEKELNELRKKASQSNESSKTKVEFSVHFKVLVKDFNDLLDSLEEIRASEGQEDFEKHKNAVIKLMDKMKENL
ncbi:Protein of unknown function [Anaerovirgula multivorans]|uniref:DUF3102 domain-containing protein n=1 Tax=Anaerovirgula multivorans TaxID=312168 RepID=A0A238ZQG9_9FIRM|nr:DUF3102 domain-containing protein [Anaerovirgula multivorans]SNR85647.1 Protein of unknown function [Anaerovirgula multivorans]